MLNGLYLWKEQEFKLVEEVWPTSFLDPKDLKGKLCKELTKAVQFVKIKSIYGCILF